MQVLVSEYTKQLVTVAGSVVHTPPTNTLPAVQTVQTSAPA